MSIKRFIFTIGTPLQLIDFQLRSFQHNLIELCMGKKITLKNWMDEVSQGK
jgi:hypothetical protein